MDNLISAISSDFEGRFWLTRGSPRTVNAPRKCAPAKQVPDTKTTAENAPPKEVISRLKFACAVTRKKLADLGGVPAVSEER